MKQYLEDVDSTQEREVNIVRTEGNFPEGAVRRAAEKAARSFQSTQPKVLVLASNITDSNILISRCSIAAYFHAKKKQSVALVWILLLKTAPFDITFLVILA
ncbi:unnamed protein product [Gongylonema pulchrum]|uniref:OKR_DC_1 domain-containing protein n=1 Tax=Gongylonema pulchrum TaxID=637853 RepID=A0A183DJZ9_9BILA|nr:unnamed protein product [Gongylonema pulchrum]